MERGRHPRKSVRHNQRASPGLGTRRGRSGWGRARPWESRTSHRRAVSLLERHANSTQRRLLEAKICKGFPGKCFRGVSVDEGVIGNTFSPDPTFRGSALETIQKLFDKDGEGRQPLALACHVPSSAATQSPEIVSVLP